MEVVVYRGAIPPVHLFTQSKPSRLIKCTPNEQQRTIDDDDEETLWSGPLLHPCDNYSGVSKGSVECAKQCTNCNGGLAIT